MSLRVLDLKDVVMLAWQSSGWHWMFNEMIGRRSDFYLEKIFWWAIYFFKTLLTGIRHSLHLTWLKWRKCGESIVGGSVGSCGRSTQLLFLTKMDNLGRPLVKWFHEMEVRLRFHGVVEVQKLLRDLDAGL